MCANILRPMACFTYFDFLDLLDQATSHDLALFPSRQRLILVCRDRLLKLLDSFFFEENILQGYGSGDSFSLCFVFSQHSLSRAIDQFFTLSVASRPVSYRLNLLAIDVFLTILVRNHWCEPSLLDDFHSWYYSGKIMGEPKDGFSGFRIRCIQ